MKQKQKRPDILPKLFDCTNCGKRKALDFTYMNAAQCPACFSTFDPIIKPDGTLSPKLSERGKQE